MIIIQQENTQDSACVSIFESRGLFSILLKGIVTSILDSRKTYGLLMGLEILGVVGLGII